MSTWNVSMRAVADDTRGVLYGGVTPNGVFVIYLNGNTSLNDSDDNSTWTDGAGPGHEFWQAILIAIACSVIIVGTIVGNLLVCLAVLIVRKLRTPSNLLIVSLAVSDLLVAVLVMPFATTMECLGRWVHGHTFCDAWTSLDVLLCTASILNLCVISIDRYFVITRPFQYGVKRTPRRMIAMIVAVWSLAAVVSIPPLFGWKSEPIEGQCMVSQSVGYQFYATIGAFYLPLTVMIVVYYRIYMVSSRLARREARSMPKKEKQYGLADVSGRSSPERKYSVPEENHNCRDVTKRAGSSGSEATTSMLTPRTSGTNKTNGEHKHALGGLFKKPWSHQQRMNSSHDSKATKTLGVIMGSFTACWLPFFIIALYRALCADPVTCIPQWLNGLFLWLGYANSLLNPIIYARFNMEFRRPFREILLCRCIGINRRLRSESYAEQYGRSPPAVGGAGALPRHSIRSPLDSVVRYNSHGQTVVRVGNGTTAT